MLGPGTELAEGRFELERQAGLGGMGAVYVALDRQAGERVAVKVLLASAADQRDRFEAEASALAHLAHPAIVRYVAHGFCPQGEPFLAMEWVEGETLATRLEHAPLSLPETLALGRRVAAALALAHDRGVVHRDIKPDNLLLPAGNVAEVKVADFGIARFEGRGRATQTGTVLGTPGYMAPEQVRAAPGLDVRADVFSLGCVLYECLTGRHAFTGEHVLAVLVKLVLEEPPRARDLVPAIPASLDDLVHRMMSKEATGRPANGRAVGEALDALGSLDVTLVRPLLPRLDAITPAEQRLMSIVLARSRGPVDTGATLSDQTLQGGPAPLDVRAAVEAHGGQAEWLADGALFATISGTGAATDQAKRAARMALSMAERLEGWALSLATGRAQRTGLWPVGEAVDAAVRIMTSEAVVRIDALTADLLDDTFEVVSVEGGQVLRGRREPSQGARRLLGRNTPCVGRDRELRLLQAVFEECVEESVARAFLITGPAGIGKSRLRYEVLRTIGPPSGTPMRRQQAEILLARGDSLRAGAPFGMLAPALRRLCGVLDGEPLDDRVGKVRARVGSHAGDAESGRIASFLGELMGVPFPDGDDVQLRAARKDARLMGDQMRRAFEDWLAAETRARPVVIVLEDLQWGDQPTVRLVDAALKALRDEPLMVLALGRPEVQQVFPNLWSGSGVVEVRLGDLSRRASERLVKVVLGEQVSAERVTWLVERSAGNAFYLEELIRAEAGGQSSESPGTVLAMVQARLEATAAAHRRILRAGSVFGQSFWRGGVAALLGESSEGAFATVLTELVDAELVSRRPEARFPGEEEYAFRHDLVREAAYGMLTDDDRSVGHRLAGEWLQAAGENDAWTLAEHFERGGDPGRAAQFCLAAARQALERNDLGAALTRAQRGLAAATAAAPALLGELRLVEAEAHRWRGDYAEALACAVEALAALEVGSDSWFGAVGEVAAAAGTVPDRARLDEVVATIGGASAESKGSAAVIARARVASELVFMGDYEVADPVLASVERDAAPLTASDPALAARVCWVRALRALVDGDMAVYLRETMDAFGYFDTAGDLRSSSTVRGMAGWARIELGDHERAEAVLRDAVAIAEKFGLEQVATVARHNLGLALARRGQLDDALSVERRAAEAFHEQGDPRFEGAARNYLCIILGLSGQLVEAEREARLAIDLLEPFAPLRAFAYANLARTLLDEGRTAEALSASDQATTLLDSLRGVEEGEATIRLVRAEALAAAGEQAAAREAISAARLRLQDRANRIGDAALRDSFASAVPENARTLELARAWVGD